MVGNGNNETDCHRVQKLTGCLDCPISFHFHNYHANIIKFVFRFVFLEEYETLKADTTVSTVRQFPVQCGLALDGYLNLQCSLQQGVKR